MSFPQTWEQFLHDYEFEDGRRIYTNGAKLMPSFRVKQMMEHYLLEAKSEAIREFAEELVDEKFSNYDKTDDILVYDIQGRIYEFAESYINRTVGDEDA
jgi:hypothetical protein